MKKLRRVRNQVVLALATAAMVNALIAYWLNRSNCVGSNAQGKPKKDIFNPLQETPEKAKEMYQALS